MKMKLFVVMLVLEKPKFNVYGGIHFSELEKFLGSSCSWLVKPNHFFPRVNITFPSRLIYF